MRCLAALFMLILSTVPLRAETPWEASGLFRAETGRIERLLYRTPSTARDDELKTRLTQIETSWSKVAAEFEASDASAVAAALAAYGAAVRQGDANQAARWRQRLWGRVLTGARARLFEAIEANETVAATNWLTIRDYARASGDTAAALAIQALGDGTLSPDPARKIVEAELLTVAASELRLALSRAANNAQKGFATEYAGDLGRIEGLVVYLEESLSTELGSDSMAALAANLERAQTDPGAIAAIAAQLAGYAPVRLSPEDRARRAALLRRFVALAAEEYHKGVRGGVVRIPFEYNEARVFRDRAAMILGDLAPQMDDAAAARLGELLARMRGEFEAKGDAVEPLAAEALALIDAEFGASVERGGVAIAFEQAAAALGELSLMAHAGDWDGAEMKRLEAYSWFDPDIEQRLVPRAPAMAMRLEARFWEGTAGRPGLGALIARQQGGAALTQEIAAILSDLEAARARIEIQLSALGAALQSAGIILREGLEAVLILAALVAALRAEGLPPGRFRAPIVGAVMLALGGSFALWAGARWLFSIATLTREALEGGTALIAAAVLVMLIMGLTSGAGHVTAFRARLAGVASPMSVGLLAFLVVFREGFETVLFYEALLADTAPLPVLAGLTLGGVAALAAGWAVFASGRRLPVGIFFKATTVLLAALAVMLAGAGIRGLQTAALVGATPVTWFPNADWMQIWFGLFPVAEPLAAQGLVLVLILALPVRRWLAGFGRSSPTSRYGAE